MWRFLPTEQVGELYKFVFSVTPQTDINFILSRTHPRQDLLSPDIQMGTLGIEEMETLTILGI
jgi:hypothetical protein